MSLSFLGQGDLDHIMWGTPRSKKTKDHSLRRELIGLPVALVGRSAEIRLKELGVDPDAPLKEVEVPEGNVADPVAGVSLARTQ